MELASKASRLLGAALLLSTAAFAAAQTGPRSGTIYCCTSAKHEQVCSEVLPPACYGREYKEMSPSGRVKRVVPAPLTADQRAAQEEAARQQKEREVQAAANRRRDQALLASYTSVGDIDQRRDRQVDEVQRSIQQYKERETELLSKRGAIQREVEFYKGKSVPEHLKRNAETNARDLSNLQELLAAKETEIETIRERFAQDRRRYIELTR